MKIIDLEEKYENNYFLCLEDWSDEIKEAGDHKKNWYAQMKDKQLGVKLALVDEDKVCGMIQYLPIGCPAQNLVLERAKRASLEFGDNVLFEEIHTHNAEAFKEWGISDALYIDGKSVRTGPPPSYDKIRKKIAKRVRKLRG